MNGSVGRGDEVSDNVLSIQQWDDEEARKEGRRCMGCVMCGRGGGFNWWDGHSVQEIKFKIDGNLRG